VLGQGGQLEPFSPLPADAGGRTDVTTTTTQPGSASLQQPDYWWYRARTRLLEVALGAYLGEPARVLDVGSADGPSVGWMRGEYQHVTVDVLPAGLTAGEGVCASAVALPFKDGSFDVVCAFDVLEHCEPEAVAMRELTRVLAPGGRLLMSVPAYQWAWTDHDVRAGHYRRYTRRRLLAAVTAAGLRPRRATYAFSAVFPFFIAERVMRRIQMRRGAPPQRLTRVPAGLDRLLMGLSNLDARFLRWGRNLPFGSSVLVAAVKE
jgi:SAM-dependent methyltransferase